MSTELTGTSPRVTVKWSKSGVPCRLMPSFTWVPLGPRSFFITFSLLMESPTKAVSFTSTTRSPARMPTFSDGPPLMTATTMMVSFWMLNCTPMPLKLPSSSLLTISSSSAGIYTECGSRSSITAKMASSVSCSTSTVSTYCASMRWSSSSTRLPLPHALTRVERELALFRKFARRASMLPSSTPPTMHRKRAAAAYTFFFIL